MKTFEHQLPKHYQHLPVKVNRNLPSTLLFRFFLLGILTPTLFRDISSSLVGDEWRRLARRLGLTRIRIEAIEHDHQADAPYYMLLAWFKRVPRSTDKISLLIHGLMNINRLDLAQDLQTMKDERRQELKISSRGTKRKKNESFEKFAFFFSRSIESISYTI
jgi:hypothetical protein